MARGATLLVLAASLAAGACGGAPTVRTPVTALRPACGVDERWDGAACAATGDARARVDAAERALADFKVEDAKAALADVEAHGPFDHDTHVKLWEQRGIAAGYVEDEPTATAAFDMLLALDPGHLLSYELSPKATFVFERERGVAKDRGAPDVDVTWAHGQRIGAPVSLELEVLADPKRFLARASVFVRERGAAAWRAADVPLAPPGVVQRLVLPATSGARASALELYARAYDERGNEVLVWADPKRPREIPLRYDPPTPWYRKWWVWTTVVGVVAAGTGVAVYAVTREPDSHLGSIPVDTAASR
jgi:hypothetical protein